MNKQEVIAYKLQPALTECEQHQRRLYLAWGEAKTFSYWMSDGEELSDDQVRTLDQLLFRFGKLQDAIGTRLLPATLQLVEEWQENEPFLDKLNRAEKLGMLPSARQWQMLRELRNQTAHEYPDQPEWVKANLRRLLEQVPILEAVYRQLADWARERIRAK
ncbi:MAG: hypothetical protein JXQ81_10945 [Desulfuromonadales bacterium]|nr:hypothetical protein [Desulfuromonadales bacterium]